MSAQSGRGKAEGPEQELSRLLSEEQKLLEQGQQPGAAHQLAKGRLLQRLARYPDALQALEDAARSLQDSGEADDPEIHKIRADVLFRMYRFNEALDAVVKSAWLRDRARLPEDWELSRLRGNAFCRLGRYREALQAYDRAEEIQREQGMPVYPFLSMNRGAVYGLMNHFDKALEAYEETERLLREQGFPDDHDLEMNRGVIFDRLARYEEALAKFGRAEQLMDEVGLPADPNLLMNRGIVFYHLNRLEDAKIQFDSSEELRRERGQMESPKLQCYRAMTLHKSGDREAAIAELMRGMETYQQQRLPVPDFVVELLRDWLMPKPDGSPRPEPDARQRRQPLELQGVPLRARERKTYDIFICYRRAEAKVHALLLRNHLTQMERRVFRDEDDLPGGRFTPELEAAVRTSRFLLLLLTPGVFDRCQNDDDMLRLELRTALQCGTRVIPVVMEGFDWPRADDLPGDIRAICDINSLTFSSEFFGAFVDKLLRWMD